MLITAIITILSFSFVSSDKCRYPSSSDSTRTFDRLQADQLTTLIPKICDNGDGCGNSVIQGDICARDPEILTEDTGCAWCTSKDADSCDPDPSNLVTDDDYYDCYSTTPESCGCVDDRGANLAVLVDVTGQSVDSFNYYLLFFAWWFSEKILAHTHATNIHYVYFTDEVVYAGDNPYDYWGFEIDDTVDTPQPQPMDELPDELKNKDQPNLCEGLAEVMDWLDSQDDTKPDLLYYIPFTSLNDESVQDCLDSDNDELLDEVATFALRFWSETDISKFESEYGFLEWCEYFQKTTYTPTQGNSPDTRYLVNTLSDFVCFNGGIDTLDPTENPTEQPTQSPTENPTQSPTSDPTENPTEDPTKAPTEDPTKEPTSDPTSQPSEHPTEQPTENPTEVPTEDPTENPTQNPTENPTENPTKWPTPWPTPWWNGHTKDKKPWWTNLDRTPQQPKWWKPGMPKDPWTNIDPWWNNKAQSPKWRDSDSEWWRDNKDKSWRDHKDTDWWRGKSTDNKWWKGHGNKRPKWWRDHSHSSSKSSWKRWSDSSSESSWKRDWKRWES